MRTSVEIQNLKCGGCGNTISNSLKDLKDVEEVVVDVEHSQVSFSYSAQTTLNKVLKTLSKLGYPSIDEKNTLGKKAKSYVSCAIGKMGN
ncbi:MAG: cation transporter [Flavobacteriaceae bacterium]